MIRLPFSLKILAIGAFLLILLDIRFSNNPTLWRLPDTSDEQTQSRGGPIHESQPDKGPAMTQDLVGSWTNLTTALEELLPDPEINRKGDGWKPATQKAIKKLLHCLALYGDKCRERPEGKVVIVEYTHFRQWWEGSTTGEVIWCGSVLAAFERLGYTTLVAEDLAGVQRLYKPFADLVRVIIMQVRFGPDHATNLIRNCFKDPKCIKSESNPSGIPPWKMFGLTFWGTRGDPIELHHPWGPSRVMAPYEFPDHYYLGYALDHHCGKNPVVPPELKKDHAFILSKRLSYYYKNPAFLPDTWLNVSQSSGLEMISAVYDDTKGEHVIPEGIRTLGRLSREDFYAMVASSRAMVGNGLPVLSPSPFDALCIGVPFIHPYDATRTKTLDPQGWDRFHSGIFQNGALLDIGPPYVYHVPRRNVTALNEALLAAKANPIGRSLPEKYKMTSLMQRVKDLVEDTDWEALAWKEGRLPLVVEKLP